MDLAVAATVFPIIFVGELPDKTMFASLILATRGRPLAVWLGAAGAFAIHVAIAVTVGEAFVRLLPHQVLDLVVAALFLLGAAYSLYESRRGKVQDDARRERQVVQQAGQRHRSAMLTAFTVIFLAEWGDLTQILMANLATRYHSALSVALGSVLALWAVAGIAVVGGSGLLRYVNISVVRKVTALILVVLAAVAASSAFS